MRRWAFSLVVLAPLTLGGCSASLDSASIDACNIHAVWVAEGEPRDDQARMISELSAVEPTDDAVEAAVNGIIASYDADATLGRASNSLSDACQAAGWQPAEG